MSVISPRCPVRFGDVFPGDYVVLGVEPGRGSVRAPGPCAPGVGRAGKAGGSGETMSMSAAA